MKTIQMRISKICLFTAIGRESATITRVSQRLKDRQRGGEASKWEEKRASGNPDSGLLEWGSCRLAD